MGLNKFNKPINWNKDSFTIIYFGGLSSVTFTYDEFEDLAKQVFKNAKRRNPNPKKNLP